jgi:hypothetical protein
MFSKIAATGIRVPRSTHAPLTLPGMLSTARHWDQSRFAIAGPPGFQNRPSLSRAQERTRKGRAERTGPRRRDEPGGHKPGGHKSGGPILPVLPPRGPQCAAIYAFMRYCDDLSDDSRRHAGAHRKVAARVGRCAGRPVQRPPSGRLSITRCGASEFRTSTSSK